MGLPISSPRSLAGLAVLVTGGSSGIGRAIALAAAAAGADVGITYRARERSAREVERLIAGGGRRTAVFQLDLADTPAIDRTARDAWQAFGSIDVWINNAGADILTGTTADLDVREKLDRLLAVDLRGTMLASWAAADLMAGQPQGGAIINMSWDHVTTGMAGRNPQLFSAVKGGINSFSKSLARSVAPKVRVNVLAPGWIETAFGAEANAKFRRSVAEATPLKRWGTPEDVAHAAVFLASRDAAFLTGQTLYVNGGVVM